MGPRASLDGCGKSRPYQDLTVQPVARRYTDYIMPALFLVSDINIMTYTLLSETKHLTLSQQLAVIQTTLIHTARTCCEPTISIFSSMPMFTVHSLFYYPHYICS